MAIGLDIFDVLYFISQNTQNILIDIFQNNQFSYKLHHSIVEKFQRFYFMKKFIICIIFPIFSPRTEMTAENLRWLENVFRRTVGENGEIRLQDFKNIVHSKNVRYPFR